MPEPANNREQRRQKYLKAMRTIRREVTAIRLRLERLSDLASAKRVRGRVNKFL